MVDIKIFNNFASQNERLRMEEIIAEADALGVEPAALIAVGSVEAGLTLGRTGGFVRGAGGVLQPKILFEPHIFSRLTLGAYDESHPHLSYPKWGMRRYGKTAEQIPKKLIPAMMIDPPVTAIPALKSASWGIFQIMGFNAQSIGYESIEEFVLSMMQGERAHLKAFIRFLECNRLVEPLRVLDFAKFAHGYNGPGYAKNKYDVKMAQKYARLTGAAPAPPLRRGSIGARVWRLQSSLVALRHLNEEPDSIFGKNTEAAVKTFQEVTGRHVNGVADRMTWLAVIDAAKAGGEPEEGGSSPQDLPAVDETETRAASKRQWLSLSMPKGAKDHRPWRRSLFSRRSRRLFA